jgi:hypothetical protein
MNPRQLLNAIRMRAYALTFASEGKVTFEQAKREATKEITAQERQRKRALQHSPLTNDGISISNARAALLARLAAIGARLKATAGLETESTPPPPQIRKHTLDPVNLFPRNKLPASEQGSLSAPDKLEPEQPPATPVYIFGTFSTSERIPDSEFANSLRWGDTATDNWRKSIELNERIQREKEQRSRWIG